MTKSQSKIILWAGPKHSGKTTAVLGLSEEARAAGFVVAGLAAPSIYEDNRLIGFDAIDLYTFTRGPLSRRGLKSPRRAGPFGFLSEGLALGHEALTRPAARSADLVIVDEFGPLELDGAGWRKEVDTLVSKALGLILLVVRNGLVKPVGRLYPGNGCNVLAAAHPAAADVVTDVLCTRLRDKTGD